MSTQRHGRPMGTPQPSAIAPHVGRESNAGPVPAGPGSAAEAAPSEVIDFIRYCYQRRRIGWPELYDEMCGVAARGEFRGMDYDRLAALGVGFSLCDMARLAALAQRVVLDERRRRVAIPVERSPIAVTSPATDEAHPHGPQAIPMPR